MKKIIIIVLIIFSQTTFAQNILKATLQDSKTHEALIGASAVVKGTTNGGSSDSSGNIVLKNIPDGEQTIVFSYIGYDKLKMTFEFPLADSLQGKVIFLEQDAEVMEEFIVTSTRTNSRIEDIPMRVEVIGQEEVSEEVNIKPSNVSKLLRESSSVQTQQTSAVNGNISIRLQGLDGKYTQMLKDGFPLYGGFAQGLSVLQIPPLDLEQVEVIKGSSSLYGSDAISGIINFVSKQPTEKGEFTLLANQTSLLGSDFNGYFSKRWNKFGLSFLSANSFQKQFDVNKDGFSDMPKISTFSLSPVFYYYFNSKTTLRFGLNGTFDNRKGGDMKVLNHKADSLHQFFNENITNRLSSQLKFNKQFENNASFTLKNSVSYFKQSQNQPASLFGGNQLSSYSEASFNFSKSKHQFVAGADLITEKFSEDSSLSHFMRDYNYVTAGIFMQDDYKPVKDLVVQAGVRADYQNEFGFFFLPRMALKYNFTDKFYARAGSGFGYKLPGIFSTASELAGINNIQPLSENNKAERSVGGNIDFNFKAQIEDDSRITFNQSFFITQINNPLVLDSLTFVTENKPIITRGFESNIHYYLDEFQVLIGYTFVDAQRKYNTTQSFIPLTPKHKLNLDVIFEEENDYSVAFEGFWVSSMFRDADTKTRSYYTVGIIVQKHFKHFTLIANGENLLDVRQTRFEDIVNPPINNPTFRELYAPIDGRVFNVAVRFDL